jgi:phage-related protein
VKLKPIFEVIGAIVGGALLVAIMALAKAFEFTINLFMNMLAVAMKVVGFMADVFVKAFDVVRDAVTWLIDKFTILIQKIRDVINTAKEIGGNVLGAIGGAIGKIFNVNDAVVAPGGNIISTHPDDYIIATKDPSSLGGAGGLTVNINGGTFLDENVASKIGDMLIDKLNLNMRGT